MAMRTGLRTRHVTTVVITATCRNDTHSVKFMLIRLQLESNSTPWPDLRRHMPQYSWLMEAQEISTNFTQKLTSKKTVFWLVGGGEVHLHISTIPKSALLRPHQESSKHVEPSKKKRQKDVCSLRNRYLNSLSLKTPTGRQMKQDGVDENEKCHGGRVVIATGNIVACANRLCACPRYKGRLNNSTAVSLNVIEE